MTDELLEIILKDCLLRETECEWFEFKTNWFDTDGIGEYISALANAATMCGKKWGFLIWGVDDKTHEIVGTKVKYKKDINNEPYEHYLARNLSCAAFEFKELTVTAKRVVVLVVDAAVRVPVSYKGVRYLRIDSSKVDASKYPEREAVLWQALYTGVVTMQNMASPRQDLTFNQFIVYFASKGINLDLNNYKHSLGLYTDDGKYNMVAYVLADNGMIPVRVAVFAGKTKADSLYSVREFGNMCMLLSLEKVNDFGDTFNIMQADERNRQLVRKEVPLFDIRSFKEAVINAFVHNKWVEGNAPMITFFSDRVEILSFGGLPSDQTIDGFFAGQSKPVNKELAEIFIQLHISEKTGRGVPTIVSHYGKDVFKFEKDSISVTLPYAYCNAVDYHATRTERKKESKTGRNESKREHGILEMMRDNPNITTLELMARMGLSQATVNKYILSLKKEGYIRRVGARKNGRWEVL